MSLVQIKIAQVNHITLDLPSIWSAIAISTETGNFSRRSNVSSNQLLFGNSPKVMKKGHWVGKRENVITRHRIEKGADNWDRGLRGACEGDHIDILKLMIEKGANNFDEGLEMLVRIIMWVLLNY